MGGSKPQPIKTPFQEAREQSNTYGTISIADSPEAQALLDVPLDFGGDGDFEVDPGVGRRTDLAEQETRNRWDSAFMGGVPREYRTMLRDAELRQVRGQGAAEAQQAEYTRKQAENQAKTQAATQKTLTDLERKRQLLPNVVQTGGSSTGSGFGTQVSQPQPGFLSSFAQGLGGGIIGAIPKI